MAVLAHLVHHHPLDADAYFTTPWSNLGLPADGLLTAATAGGMAAAAAFVATLAQRGVFAYARGVWAASKMGGVLRKRPVLRLAIGWLLNFGLYGAATAGAVLIAHYRLDTVQLTVGFSTRATMALMWNLCATAAAIALPDADVVPASKLRGFRLGGVRGNDYIAAER